jgi:hypothetical protein
MFSMKTRVIQMRVRKAWVGLLVGIAALLSGGCTGVVYTEPGPGGYYYYDYYPGLDVYFYPEAHVYYWSDEGHWHSGGRLPRRYDLHREYHERLRLHSREPWKAYHGEHEEFEERHRH